VSVISDALKEEKNVHLLVEIEEKGLVRRWADRDIAVPNSEGDDVQFDGVVRNQLVVGGSLNLRNMRQVIPSVRVEIANKERVQDLELTHKLDGIMGRIYVWCKGLDYPDMTREGKIFEGMFQKESHTLTKYVFHIEDPCRAKLNTIPGNTINADTWPNMRTEGGGGSVAGLPQAIVFGDWSKGVPLLCVDTAAFKYVVAAGKALSADADYTATTENVYDKDGAVTAAANYTFYPDGYDGEGNLVSYFDFTGDQAANEPLSCSIQGLYDGSGEYTGTADELIEDPAHILLYMLDQFSGLSRDEFSGRDIKTMSTLLPGLKFAAIVNSQVDGMDVVDRVLKQCNCLRVSRAGKMGVMVFGEAPAAVAHLTTNEIKSGSVKFSRTPKELLCNDLKIFYALNPTTGKYEGDITLDRSNHAECELSFYQYGAQPQRIIHLPDVQSEAMARYLGNRHISLWAFRHELVDLEALYWPCFDIIEGDGAVLSLDEGASLDGSGWSEEPCILLSRRFKKDVIAQQWWRVSTK